MKKLVSMLAGAMMFTVMAGSALALNLYDANGQNLGTFLGVENTAYSSFATGWKGYYFQADGRIWGWTVNYPTPDCSGQAYIAFDSGASYQTVFRIADTLYTGKKTNLPASMLICSTKNEDGSCNADLCNDPAYADQVPGKYIPVVDVTERLPFDYPVAWPLTYK